MAAADVARARASELSAPHKLIANAAPANAAPAKTAARGRIDAATLTHFRQAELTWRLRRVDAAKVRLGVVTAEQELDRAKAIDRHLVVGETYVVATYRGQVARAQQDWYAAQDRVTVARADEQRASIGLASAKDAFARLLRAEVETNPLADQARQAVVSLAPRGAGWRPSSARVPVMCTVTIGDPITAWF